VSEATAFVRGSAGFADAALRLLVAAGLPVERIHVELLGEGGPERSPLES
jgi:ferredoxin-NADP reductase